MLPVPGDRVIVQYVNGAKLATVLGYNLDSYDRVSIEAIRTNARYPGETYTDIVSIDIVFLLGPVGKLLFT